MDFLLPAYDRYRLTVDGGCFYCLEAGGEGGLVPELYLVVE
ncbi:hypothetical protein ACFLWN_03140 [Chloroflexota bacterium]